jgi:Plasma-membrane choline transporter
MNIRNPYYAITGQKPPIVTGDEVKVVPVQPMSSSGTPFQSLSPRSWSDDGHEPSEQPTRTRRGKWTSWFSRLSRNRNSKDPTGEASSAVCRDVFWALLFYAHLIAIAACTFLYAPAVASSFAPEQEQAEQLASQYNYNPHTRRFLEEEAAGDDGNNNNNQQQDDEELELNLSPRTILILLSSSALLSLVFSSLALGLIMSCAEVLVKGALFFNIALFASICLMAFLSQVYGLAVVLLVLTALVAFYTCRAWNRIPFAAANLSTAVSAIRSNMGLAFYAYWSVLLVFLWSAWWSVASFSTLYVTNGCQVDGNCETQVNGGIIFLFFLSYYWTAQVIRNVVHCTTAGTVATWWYDPVEARGCCSTAVRQSYWRSLTYSFGSICLASLIVAIVEAIRELLHSMRENGDSFLTCIVDCCLACVESLVELFNRFALVYCAVHGHGFIKAGRSVMDLFRARGWSVIIADLLVDTCLNMMSIGVGLVTGLLCLVLAGALQPQDGGQGEVTLLAIGFGIGFLVGYSVCAVLFSLVSSAVSTVIVCYAEAPNEFQRNHAELSQKMRVAWRQAWPNDFSY